jgi:hypothetical protein
MGGKWKSSLTAIAIGAVLSACGVARAGNPFDIFDFNRVEADPTKDYALTEENGPWMILACTFSSKGADAKQEMKYVKTAAQQAHDLVLELRQRYKCPAYIYSRDVKPDKAPALGLDEYGNPLRMKYKTGEFVEIAVLVGNYQAIDAPEARKTLQDLKYATPYALRSKDGDPTTRELAAWRSLEDSVKETFQYWNVNKSRAMGPMGHAFLTANPLLPKDYFAPKGVVDKTVAKMNEDVQHSLLDCPGRYTVQIAHFTGSVILDQRKIRDIANGQPMESRLAEAAINAHRMTEMLRSKGVDAYEFHDYHASIVTVGSFNSLGTPRADGRTELQPRIAEIIKTYGAQKENLSGADAMQAKATPDGIPYDVSPIVVEVPKRSISADYRRSALSER